SFDSPGPQSTIQNSTISGNSANDSSAISSSGLLTIANSTVSGNTATSTTYTASAIFAGKTLTLRNSTVAFNHATNGAAIWFNNIKYQSNAHYAVDFESSIVANNTSNGGEADVYSRVDPSRALTITGANNIVISASAGAPPPGDTLARDPLLLPLANNGGPTQTHAFRDASPAYGHGNNNANLGTDQRGSGFSRTVNGATDIGAFQQQVRDVIFANGFD
ncbi:MAG TPA: choice-of-anchor Q domain-containing protein, partial [Rudaea sp.]|nr:choice-of-anchor Q domain-containing protein [Rudaea sp.]